MTTTIGLSTEAHKELTLMKLEEGYPNMDELVHQLIVEHKKYKLIKASEKIRARMKKLKVSLTDLIE